MHVKAQVTFQGATNVPKDRFINTFHFDSTEGSLTAAATAIGPQLGTFYGSVAYPNPTGMGAYLSQFVLRPFKIRYYDMAQAEPRVPYEQSFSLGTYPAGATFDLPEEVAACLSFHGAPPITARRRGRIFLGPLNGFILNDATTTLPARVDSSFRTGACTAMLALANADLGWSVYSQTTDTLVPVTGGWADDAFDTQRRRGPAPSARSTWALP